MPQLTAPATSLGQALPDAGDGMGVGQRSALLHEALGRAIGIELGMYLGIVLGIVPHLPLVLSLVSVSADPQAPTGTERVCSGPATQGIVMPGASGRRGNLLRGGSAHCRW